MGASFAESRPSPAVVSAGIGIRFVSLLVDGIILFAIDFVLGMVLGDESLLSSTISIVVWLAYDIGFLAAVGQTPAMMLFKLRAVDASGQKIGGGAAVIRAIMSWVSALLLVIGYLWAFWDGERRTLHDKVAGTYIVRA